MPERTKKDSLIVRWKCGPARGAALISRHSVLLAAGSRGLDHHGDVEILFWLLPPAVVTVLAMLWVSWLGRARDVGPDRSEAAQERFAAAIMRELPSEVTSRVAPARPVRDRSTGIAVRPSQRSTPSGTPAQHDDGSRRSA